MATFTFTISDEKVQRVIAAMKGLHPIPRIPDPDWVNPGDGSERPKVDEYTGPQWAKERVRRWIRDEVARYEKKLLVDAIAYSPEDDLVG